MKMKSSVYIVISILTFFIYSQAGAEVIDLNWVDANTAIDYGPQDETFDDFATYNFASVNNNGYTSYRTALEFDLSSIPAGSIINTAVLYAAIGYVGGTRSIALHGYAGDGVLQLADFTRDGLVDSKTLSGQQDQDVAFNVQGIIASLVTDGEMYAGFNFREDPPNDQNFGVIGLDNYVAFLRIDFTPPANVPETVAIDIKPGKYPNSIQLSSEGVVAVAILTTPEFDTSMVDPSTVIFANASPIKWTIEDVDYDGDMDMLLHFYTRDLSLEANSFKATLTGMTHDDGAIVGTDSIRIVVPGPPPTCTQPPDGLTGWWPGDGNTYDIIGGQNAVLEGGATTGLGFVGKSFILDGDGDFIRVSDTPSLNVGTEDFTVALWAFFNDTTGEQVLVEKFIQAWELVPSEGWTLTKLEDNSLGFGTFSEETGASVDTPYPLPIAPFTWYHFAATRQFDPNTETTTLTTYMNGVLVAIAEDAPVVNADSASSLKFGHRGNPSDTPGSQDDRGFYLNGGIDEAQIFVGRALAGDQVRAIFEAGRAGMCKEQY
jgi:hypothetical protein